MLMDMEQVLHKTPGGLCAFSYHFKELDIKILFSWNCEAYLSAPGFHFLRLPTASSKRIGAQRRFHDRPATNTGAIWRYADPELWMNHPASSMKSPLLEGTWQKNIPGRVIAWNSPPAANHERFSWLKSDDHISLINCFRSHLVFPGACNFSYKITYSPNSYWRYHQFIQFLSLQQGITLLLFNTYIPLSEVISARS